jgi:hypothetical protein
VWSLGHLSGRTTAVSGEQRPSQQWIVKVSGAEEIRVAPGESIEIGRKPMRPIVADNVRRLDVPDSSKSMSKRHALFQVTVSGSATLRDLGSTNGSYIVRNDGGLIQVPLDTDFLLPRSPMRFQFGDVPVDFVKVDVKVEHSPATQVSDLFTYATSEGVQEPDAADMSVDDILDLRAGEPTSAFDASSVRSRIHALHDQAIRDQQQYGNSPVQSPVTDNSIQAALQAQHDASKLSQTAADQASQASDGHDEHDEGESTGVMSTGVMGTVPAAALSATEPNAEGPKGESPSLSEQSVAAASVTGEVSDAEDAGAVAASSDSNAGADVTTGAEPNAAVHAAPASEEFTPTHQEGDQAGARLINDPDHASDEVAGDGSVQESAGGVEGKDQTAQPTAEADAEPEPRDLFADALDDVFTGVDPGGEHDAQAASKGAADGGNTANSVHFQPLAAAQLSSQEQLRQQQAYERSDVAQSPDQTTASAAIFEPGSVFERVSKGGFEQPQPLVEVAGMSSDDARNSRDFAEQFEMAKHPELLPFLAMNVALYDDLYAWLAAQGNQDVDTALSKNKGYQEYLAATRK